MPPFHGACPQTWSHDPDLTLRRAVGWRPDTPFDAAVMQALSMEIIHGCV
jgi:hypothetical protein